MTYFRPNRFPPVVKNLIIINALIFLLQMALKNQFPIDNLFALHDVHSVFFSPYQLITYMFMHGSIGHLLVNMLALWVFGSGLEEYWGAKRFIQFYFICGIGAGLLHLFVLYLEMEPIMAQFRMLSIDDQLSIVKDPNFKVNIATVGASGAVFGCLAAFGYLFPNRFLYVYGMIPIKAKWLVLAYGGLELMMAIQNSAGDNVAHFAHLGGAIAGLIVVFIWNKKNKRTLY
jgi:membrane associated rhomboid family serine protease